MEQDTVKLSEFLTRLADDATLQEQYAEDQEGVLAGSGLSPENQQLLRDEDLRGIQAALAGEGIDEFVVFGIIKIWPIIKR